MSLTQMSVNYYKSPEQFIVDCEYLCRTKQDLGGFDFYFEDCGVRKAPGATYFHRTDAPYSKTHAMEICVVFGNPNGGKAPDKAAESARSICEACEYRNKEFMIEKVRR